MKDFSIRLESCWAINFSKAFIYWLLIFYNWKSKYGGLDVQQLSKMKEMEKQLSQYKKIVAEQTLEIVVLKDVIEKKL